MVVLEVAWDIGLVVVVYLEVVVGNTLGVSLPILTSLVLEGCSMMVTFRLFLIDCLEFEG